MSYLDGAETSPDGLVVHGDPRDSARLVLGVDALTVRAGHQSAELPWSAMGHGWELFHHVSNIETTSVQFGVRARGVWVEPMSLVRQEAPAGVLTRMMQQHGAADSCLVLVFDTPSRATITQVKEMWTVFTLCSVLADHEPVRRRLTDQERLAHLIKDMRAAPKVPKKTAKLHLKPAKATIASAMAACGFVHHYGGRPVPGVTPDVARDDAIAAVVSRLRASPSHGMRRPPSARAVGNVLDNDYLHIAPWPFAAITQETPTYTVAPEPSRARAWMTSAASFFAPRR